MNYFLNIFLYLGKGCVNKPLKKISWFTVVFQMFTVTHDQLANTGKQYF